MEKVQFITKFPHNDDYEVLIVEYNDDELLRGKLENFWEPLLLLNDIDILFVCKLLEKFWKTGVGLCHCFHAYAVLQM